MSLIAESICYRLARSLLFKNHLGRYRDLSCISENEEEFEHWRGDVLRKSLDHFAHIPLSGKTVLDFGCGGGRLSILLKERGAEKVYGVDLNPEVLRQARKANPYGSSVEFLVGAESSIPLPPSSVDLIFCISVLEHVMDVDSMLREWWRILRRGGHVLIHWSAWHHPDGSHLGSVIPIPYAQCLFSERTLARTAARIKLSQGYRPKFWDYDAHTGLRREVFIQDTYTQGFLNKMAIVEFKGKLRTAQLFQTTHYECHPPAWFSYIRPLLRIPFLREHFSSFATYVLTKPRTEKVPIGGS
jgi:SAM-dependent methyltransferase